MKNNRSQSDGSESMNSRSHLLSVAEMLFARHGFNGTSIRTIADESGSNSAMINYYYGSKEGLYREIFKSRLLGLRSAIRQIEVSGVSPRCMLEGFLDVYIHRVRKNSPFHRILNRELNMPQIPTIKKMIMESTKENFQWLKKVVQQGIDAGVFKEIKVEYFVLNVFTFLPAVLSGSPIVDHLLETDTLESNDWQLKQYLMAMLSIDETITT